ncbi:hypothetical protein Tco_0601749 [Tanacetum coccineum]
MRTKTEQTLEQTQQGVSDEVLAETGLIHMLSETPKLLSGIEDSHHGPSDEMHNPPQPLKSDTKVFIMMMEILPEPTSNKLCGRTSRKDAKQAFKDQEKYEHVGLKVTSTQDGKISQDDDKILYSADDLKNLKDHMQVKRSDVPYGEIVRNREKTRSLLKYVARRTSSVSSNNPILSFLKRFNGIKFIHKPKSPKVSKGLESPSLQGCPYLEYELNFQEPLVFLNVGSRFETRLDIIDRFKRIGGTLRIIRWVRTSRQGVTKVILLGLESVPLTSASSVSDISKRTKTKPKQTKPSTGLEELEEIKTEGIYIFKWANPHAGNTKNYDWLLRRVEIQGLKWEDLESRAEMG